MFRGLSVGKHYVQKPQTALRPLNKPTSHRKVGESRANSPMACCCSGETRYKRVLGLWRVSSGL